MKAFLLFKRPLRLEEGWVKGEHGIVVLCFKKVESL